MTKASKTTTALPSALTFTPERETEAAKLAGYVNEAPIKKYGHTCAVLLSGQYAAQFDALRSALAAFETADPDDPQHAVFCATNIVMTERRTKAAEAKKAAKAEAKKAEDAAPEGVNAKEWAEYQAFKAFKAAQANGGRNSADEARERHAANVAAASKRPA